MSMLPARVPKYTGLGSYGSGTYGSGTYGRRPVAGRLTLDDRERNRLTLADREERRLATAEEQP